MQIKGLDPMTHGIYVSQLHLVHQTQYFIEWVVYIPFKLQIEILQGSSEFFKDTLAANEIGFAPLQPFVNHIHVLNKRHKRPEVQ